MRFKSIQRFMLVVGCLVAAESCESDHGTGAEDVTLEVQRQAASVVSAWSPEEVNLTGLARGELRSEDPRVLELLRNADALVRRGIGYRKDSRENPLTRTDLHALPDSLSCSEFVWVVYSLAGMDLGNHHIETKELAFDKGVYAPYLVKLQPHEEIHPGDMLVYEYPDEQLIEEEEESGRYRAGHVVIVVSALQRIVVGSHGDESTPPQSPTGAGYRRLLEGWNRWTAGRTLRAIYRLSETRRRETIPPQTEKESPVGGTSAPTAQDPEIFLDSGPVFRL